MYCEKCGAFNDEGSKFCQSCGNLLIQAEIIDEAFAPEVAEETQLLEQPKGSEETELLEQPQGSEETQFINQQGGEETQFYVNQEPQMQQDYYAAPNQYAPNQGYYGQDNGANQQYAADYYQPVAAPKKGIGIGAIIAIVVTIAVLIFGGTVLGITLLSGDEGDTYEVSDRVEKREKKHKDDDQVETTTSEVAIDKTLSDYSVSVRQYDMSTYPVIKLYVDVNDTRTGEFVDNLRPEAFHLLEGRDRDTEGNLAPTSLIRAEKLNDNAGISIGLVADVSGSMDYYMDEAKQMMNNFTSSLQYDKGDKVEIVEFSDTSYCCQYFTSDIDLLHNAIDNMEPMGGTRLYDTLINEIVRINTETNAKCVIGFTDGYDNESVSTPQDVVNMAKQYNIPVFIIGVGSSVDSGNLTTICDGSGGKYMNIYDMTDLYDIYNQIYGQQKDVYLLEYEASNSDNLDKNYYADIYIQTENGTGGHQENYCIEPEDFFTNLYSRYLIAGIDCQTKGVRNLINSGLIITTDEAFKNEEYIAQQSQWAIDNDYFGLQEDSDSGLFEVLVDYEVLDIVKEGDGYLLYGRSNYDITRHRPVKKCNEAEKEAISEYYGSLDSSTEVFFEENITNYEKLRIVKDSDGLWKFSTRKFEKSNGDYGYECNAIYRCEIY